MLYRCKVCGHEEVRGCLPAVSCGLYLIGLLWLSACLFAATAHGLRSPLSRDADVSPASPPWWYWLIGCPASLVLMLLGAVLLKYLLELIEFLVFILRRCPVCGGHRWSWGYTRGFGL